MSHTLSSSSRSLSQVRHREIPQSSAGTSEIRRILIGRELFAEAM